MQICREGQLASSKTDLHEQQLTLCLKRYEDGSVHEFDQLCLLIFC